MTASISVSRSEFIQTMKQLSRLTRVIKNKEAILAFDDSNFIITLGGATVRLPAEGDWPGEAIVAATLLFGIGKDPPARDPLTITVKDSVFGIQNWHTGCRWQSPELAAIQVPLGATQFDYLRLGLIHTLEEIDRSGLRPEYDRAIEKRNEKLTIAYLHLREYGIKQHELLALVNKNLIKDLTD